MPRLCPARYLDTLHFIRPSWVLFVKLPPGNFFAFLVLAWPSEAVSELCNSTFLFDPSTASSAPTNGPTKAESAPPTRTVGFQPGTA